MIEKARFFFVFMKNHSDGLSSRVFSFFLFKMKTRILHILFPIFRSELFASTAALFYRTRSLRNALSLSQANFFHCQMVFRAFSLA